MKDINKLICEVVNAGDPGQGEYEAMCKDLGYATRTLSAIIGMASEATQQYSDTVKKTGIVPLLTVIDILNGAQLKALKHLEGELDKISQKSNLHGVSEA